MLTQLTSNNKGFACKSAGTYVLHRCKQGIRIGRGSVRDDSVTPLSRAPFTQDAEVLANVARKKWNTLLPIGVFTQDCKHLQATSKDLQANLRANLLTCPV